MSFDIHARFVHIDNATLRREQYADGSPALVAEYADGDGDSGDHWVETEALTVNLSAYGLTLDDGCVAVKNWAEHEGLPEALAKAGVGVIEETLLVGPFNSPAAVLRLNEGVGQDA